MFLFFILIKIKLYTCWVWFPNPYLPFPWYPLIYFASWEQWGHGLSVFMSLAHFMSHELQVHPYCYIQQDSIFTGVKCPSCKREFRVQCMHGSGGQVVGYAEVRSKLKSSADISPKAFVLPPGFFLSVWANDFTLYLEETGIQVLFSSTCCRNEYQESQKSLVKASQSCVS